MAERQATWLKDGVSTGAVEERLAMASLISRPGVDRSPDLLVTAPGTTNVSVAVGGAWVARTAAFQGPEHVVNDSAKLLGIGATIAGVSRSDLIVARITALGWALEVVPGVAAASPSDPVQPTDSLLLARVVVPASTSVITGAMLTDLRVQYALGNGATVSAVDATARTALAVYPGLLAWQVDTAELWAWTGAVWESQMGKWQAYTPILRQGGVMLGIQTNGSRYVVRGDTCTVRYLFQPLAAGTAPNQFDVSIPITPPASAYTEGAGTMFLNDASVPLLYKLAVRNLATDASKIVFNDGPSGMTAFFGNVPSVALAINDTIFGTITYECT